MEENSLERLNFQMPWAKDLEAKTKDKSKEYQWRRSGQSPSEPIEIPASDWAAIQAIHISIVMRKLAEKVLLEREYRIKNFIEQGWEEIWRRSCRRYTTTLSKMLRLKDLARGPTQLLELQGRRLNFSLKLRRRLSHRSGSLTEATASSTQRRKLKLKDVNCTRCFWIHNFKRTWHKPKVLELKPISLSMCDQRTLLLYCKQHQAWGLLKSKCISRTFITSTLMAQDIPQANTIAQSPSTTNLKHSKTVNLDAWTQVKK